MILYARRSHLAADDLDIAAQLHRDEHDRRGPHPPQRTLQNTDDIAVFRIQQGSGRLDFIRLVNTPTPVDVEFDGLA